VQGKSKKISPKSQKKLRIPKEEWITVKNTHEPLVSQEVFDAANLTVNTRYNQYKDSIDKNGGMRNSIFRGVVFCENCGGKLNTGGTVYRGEYLSYWYLSCCNIPSRSKNHCEHGARIRYHALLEIVTQELNRFIDLPKEQIDEILDTLRKETSMDKHNARIQKQCEQIRKEISESDKILENLYRDNVTGKLSDDRFYSMLQSIEQKCKQQKENLSSLQSQIINKDPMEDYQKFFDIVQQYTHITELTPEIIHAFIDRIEIGESTEKRAKKKETTQTVRIYYKFIGDRLNTPETMRHENGIYAINS